MLDQAQVDIVKATVPIIEKYGNTVTDVFYKNLLHDHPDLNSMFNQANQATGHQAKALAAATYAYAKNIENLGALGPAVQHITNKHASLLIQPEQYDVVGAYLLDAFAQVLGEAFTSDIRAAWAAAYGQLAQVMINAEANLYQQKNGWTGWRDFVICDKIPETTEITSFYLKPVQHFELPKYVPGQYISIKVDVPILKYDQTRQYSLSDSPDKDYYRISVKKEAGVRPENPEHVARPGYVSNVLHDLKQKGDVVQISAPSGDFLLSVDGDTPSPIVLISAGIGVTPLMSMLNHLTRTSSGSKRQISWVQGARSSDLRPFAGYINNLRQSDKDLRITVFIKNVKDGDQDGIAYDKVGRLNLDQVDREKDLFVGDKSTTYFVCGPDPFMADIQAKLLDFGVNQERIKSERFGTG